MTDTARTIDIVMWGSTQVGKTTALVAYLSNLRTDWLAEDTETIATRREIRRSWNLLLQNQLIGGTVQAAWYPLRRRDGATVRFRDMRGDASRDLDEGDAEDLRTAAAGMIFVEWPTVRATSDDVTVGNALQELGERPRALVITKCECGLSAAEFAQLALNPTEFVSKHTSVPEHLCRMVKAFPPEAVFPITVYGWRDGLPAQYYDEFGQFVPWQIAPALVERPFDYILGSLSMVSHT